MSIIFNKRMGNGFHMTFANGWTISIQQRDGSYATLDKTVEIAAWDSEGDWHDFGQDTVLGHVSSDDLVTWINKFATMEGDFE